MVTVRTAAVLQAVSIVCVLLCYNANSVDAAYAWEVNSWTESHVTFYGDASGSATMGGACGFGNMWSRGYDLNTAALSTTLFNNGLTCGACFQIRCNFLGGYSSKWCHRTGGTVTVTATNFCPPNWGRPTNNGGWCNPPRTHFDLPLPTFERIASPVAGIIPVLYRRVRCVRSGGIKFSLGGNPWFNLVLIYNVGGAGDIKSLRMRGGNSPWYWMHRNWGENWQLAERLTGKSLSFIVTLSNGQERLIETLTPRNWYFGQTYEARTNF